MLVGRLLRHYGAVMNLNQNRSASILSSLNSSHVLVSTNKDVYTNLALEHWLYTNLKFGEDSSGEILKGSKVFQKPIVLVWTDEPCVVIGRHQNPWVETSLGFINKSGIKLARRHSGGGCVFHDENNINISIIGGRETFEKRQDNLKFLAQVLDKDFGIKCEPTKRHDLIHSDTGLKISGSAAKLGRFNSYHHFTVLVDTNKESLYGSIRQNQQDFIQTNATQSTRSKVINLKDIKSDIDVDRVISSLTNAYGQLYGDPKPKDDLSHDDDRIEGDENDYRSLKKFRDDLLDWNWIYGMTPKFKLDREFKLMENGDAKQIKFSIHINKGLFESIDIDCNLTGGNPVETFRKVLIGTKFSYTEAMVTIITKLLKLDEENSSIDALGPEKLLATYMLQMIRDVND